EQVPEAQFRPLSRLILDEVEKSFHDLQKPKLVGLPEYVLVNIPVLQDFFEEHLDDVIVLFADPAIYIFMKMQERAAVPDAGAPQYLLVADQLPEVDRLKAVFLFADAAHFDFAPDAESCDIEAGDAEVGIVHDFEATVLAAERLVIFLGEVA